MKKKIVIVLVMFIGLNNFLSAQYINRNEYIKVYNDLYAQYSPKLMGWQLFKYNSYENTYEHKMYKDSKSEKEYSSFENIYVVEPYLLFTKENGLYKQISVYSDRISEGVENIFMLDGHPIQKATSGKYYSLVNPPVACDTFAILNSYFYASLDKKYFQEDKYIFTKNGFIVPLYYGYTDYYYVLKKNKSGYQLANTRVIPTITPEFIYTIDESAKYLTKQFHKNIKLSYYTGNSFLISERRKWYICKLPLHKENFEAYLKDEKVIIPRNDESFIYFGDLDAESITIISWESDKPKFFIARIQNKDYIFDYDQKLISRGGEKIQFEPISGIQGDFIKPHTKELGYNKLNNADYIEIRNGKNIDYYKIENNDLLKLNSSPLRDFPFSAVFLDSKYLVSDVNGSFQTKTEFEAEMTDAEIQFEVEMAEVEIQKERAERLKIAFINSRYYADGIIDFAYPNFPQKSINGEQWIQKRKAANSWQEHAHKYILDENNELIPLPKIDYTSIYIRDELNRKIAISLYRREIIPNIDGNYFQAIGIGESSYDNKKFITIETIKKTVNGNSISQNYSGYNIIDMQRVFEETQQHIEIDGRYGFRLSNNDILLIFKIELKYLSNQLNRMFGINGYNNISRTFSKRFYWKFIVLSEDGAELKTVNNYLFPINDLYFYKFNRSLYADKEHIKLIDGGLLIISENLGEIVKLNNNDFGIKKSIYSAEAGRNIMVTQNINFANVTSSERGIKIFKFDNTGELVNQLTIGNPDDPNIYKPSLLYFSCSENYICVSYLSYELNVINRATKAYDLYDKNLNFIERRLYTANYTRDRDLPSNAGIVSLNDKFYYYQGRRPRYDESIDFFKLPNDLFEIRFKKTN